MDIETILCAIGSTESSSFNEFCSALGDDCPKRGDTEAWAELFRLLEAAEFDGLVEIDRGSNGINSLTLTEEGEARAKEHQRRHRAGDWR